MTDPNKTAEEAANEAANAAPKKTGKKKKPSIDVTKLTDLATYISSFSGTVPSHAIEGLRKREGLKIRATTEGRIYVSMAGIEAGARGKNPAIALTNWANKARREMRKAG